MTFDEDDSPDPVRRREVLQAGIAMPALAAGIPAPSLDRQTRIVTDRAGKHQDAVRTRKVPKKWLRHEQEIRRTNRALGAHFEGDEFVRGTEIGVSDKREDGLAYARQVIRIAPGTPERKRRELPSSLSESAVNHSSAAIRDDQIEIRVAPEDTTPLTCAGDETFDPYPGGLYIKSRHAYGTGGYMMKQDSGGKVLVSANHVFADLGWNGGSWDCYVGDTYAEGVDIQGREVGDVIDGHPNHDWVILNVTSTGVTDLANDIYREGSSRVPIGGYKEQNGIAAIKGQTDAISKMGQSTGLEHGTLVGYNSWKGAADGCEHLDGNGIRVDINGAKMDSGGPIFATDYDYDYSDGNGGEYASVITQSSIASNSTGNYACNGREIYSRVDGWPTYKIINNNPYYVPKW